MANSPLEETFERYLEALQQGDRGQALQVVKVALANGCDVHDIYLSVFQPAMYEIGRLWEQNQFTIGQEHLATAITQSIMAQIYGAWFMKPPNGCTVIATCIGGELHELGIRMVADFFEMEGWNVYYLGANAPSEIVVSMARERRADLLALSITLRTQMQRMREVIMAVRQSPVGGKIKIMVGGQPLNRNPAAARALEADFVVRDAREAVAVASGLVPC